jgi:hypothetical protein
MSDPIRRLGIPLTTMILVIFMFGVAWTKHSQGMERIDRLEANHRELEHLVGMHTALLERIDERTGSILEKIKTKP